MLENRLITTIAIGYIIGIIIGLYCKISVVLLYFSIMAVYLIFKRPTEKRFKLVSAKRYKRYLKIIFTKKVITIIIISSIISNSIILLQNKKIEKMYSNLKEVDIVATIVSNPIQKQYKTVYKIKVENINNNNKYKNSYLYLQTNKNQKKIDYGEKVKIKGTYIEPTTRKNYKGFDYKEYLKTQKIYGTVKGQKIEKLGTNNKMFIKIYANTVFLKIKDKIQSKFDDEKANVLLGILLGYTTEMDEDIKENFNESNISHILAVSGMHIGYIVVFIMTITRNIIGKRKSIIITNIVIIIYMFITSFSASVVRTVIMVVIDNMGKILYRKSDIIQNISIAILITLINNPFAIKNISVLLTYGAVLGILLLKKVPIAFSATIFIFPIITIFFHKIPITAVIVSSFIGIAVAPIIIIGFIFIILNLGFFNSFLIKILSIFLRFLIKTSKFGSNIPMNKIYVVTPNVIEIIIYYIFIIGMFYLYKIYHVKEKTAFTIRIRNLMSLLKYRINQYKDKIIWILLILILIFVTFKIIPKNLKIYFIDVGQGDSTLIVTPQNKKILIDGGGDPSGKYDVGKNTLIPYLLDRRIKTLDYIIISHTDVDHMDGLLTVMEELKVKNVIIGKQFEVSENYQKLLKIVKDKKVNLYVAEAGQSINIEKKLYFDILWPNSKNKITDNVLNNNSIVCKLNYCNFSMLFTGDIEEIAEKAILDEYKNTNILKSTVIKVAHHGSKSSSIQEFLDNVRPKIALIGVGANNTFGHPNSRVLERLNRCGSNIYRTDEDGEITIKVNKNGKMWVKKMLN